MREYSTREVADLAGLPESRVRRWAKEGILDPYRDEKGRYHYSFQDLALLRTAARLFEVELSAGRVTRSLRLIRKQLPEGRPLSAVRIFVAGNKVVVKDRFAAWEPESRQGMLDLDAQDVSPRVAKMPGGGAAGPKAETAEELYELGIDLELTGRADDARAAYQRALDKNPDIVGARINIGRLVHTAGSLPEAESHYRMALEHEPGNALAAFNLGVALEDQGKTDAAIDAYQRALVNDKDYIDAHFNLARLLEARGDNRGALRHLSRFKRLLEG